jgi:type II secretory pathway component GspD/PulD (secretin)
VHAEEPAKQRETPPAESAATPSPQADSAATAAEPIPTVPATPPVMPTTVVRPSSAQGAGAAAPAPALPLSVGRYGAIELGRPPQTASRWRGFPISLSLRDAPLPEVLRSFARIAGLNLVLSPGVTGNVTVELKDVPWDQALWVILKTQGMGAEIDGNVWSVAPY